jgi:hypothetical protein
MSTIPASEFRIGIMMKCGCSAQGTVSRPGQPAVVSCAVHACTDVADGTPDLTGRTAVCSYGGNEVPSRPDLAFFQHCPNEKHDRYYCGCYGWD